MTESAPTFDESDHQQNLTLLKIYSGYRFIVAAALLLTFLLEPFQHVGFGGHRPLLFLFTVGGFTIYGLAAMLFVLPRRRQLNSHQLFLCFFTDVAIIILLMDASGGIRSGLELLLVVTVAASTIMLPIKLALLIAALASLALLADTFSLINTGDLTKSSFVYAGLVGLILFVTTFFIQNLAARIRGSQLLAEQRAVDVSKLQQLNQQIVQGMRTGIVVCNRDGQILLANNAAGELLGDAFLNQVSTTHPKDMPAALRERLEQWQSSPRFHAPPLQVEQSERELQVSFSAINDHQGTDTLIFLEDNRRIAQRAQQMKLASLGRLTASIAHEIRNPLGAISHAAQLLHESQHLDDGDKRLCDIVQNHAGRMNKVIENVLQLSTRSAPNPEKTNLQDWLQEFIEEFDYLDNPEFSIELVAEDGPYETTIDTTQLHQVLTNLCQNGLRFSEQHTGKAIVTFRLRHHSTTDLPILDIIDYGPGVGDEAIEHIFEPFYTTDPKGSGLGLYISRELCEANEARLDYIRTDEGHSCFRISLPHPDRRLQPE